MECVNGDMSCNMFATGFDPFGTSGDCSKTSGSGPVETSGFDPSGNSGLEPGGDGSIISGDPWVDNTAVSEGLLEDFSGCTWTSTLFEFPPWITSLEKTISDHNVQDVLGLPAPLTPPKMVTSNTATVDFELNLGTSVPVEQRSNKVTVQSVEYPETTCVCCLCQAPDFFCYLYCLVIH